MAEDSEKAYYREKIREKTDGTAWMPLPGPEWALAPDWSVFYDDISNPDQFNERFIESRVAIGGMASALKLFSFMFFMTVVVFIVDCIFYGNFFGDSISLAMMVVMICVTGAFFIIALIHSRPAPVRFNRQAQLVHVTTLPKREVITVPWNEVQAFIHFSRDLSGWYNLKLLFPVRKPDKNNKINEPLEVPGDISSVDKVFPTAALKRWEFIRAYMEGGIHALNIDEELKEKGELIKPTGFSNDIEAQTLTSKLWRFAERILVYPLYFEKLLKQREANFRWPEEVEQLCAPDADLSNLNTRPIPSHKDMYYLLDQRKGIIWGTPETFRAQGHAVKREA